MQMINGDDKLTLHKIFAKSKFADQNIKAQTLGMWVAVVAVVVV